MRWYAKLSNGDVEAMTLDELDAAYERGIVDASTLVLTPAATEWVTLGELAALSESPGPSPIGGEESEPICVPETKARPKWLAPMVVGAVATLVFVAAGFEALQAGAFSRRRMPVDETAALTRGSAVTAPASSGVDRTTQPLASGAAEGRTVRPALEASPKRSSAPSAGAPPVPGTGQARVFTSGGDRYDPLNGDLP